MRPFVKDHYYHAREKGAVQGPEAAVVWRQHGSLGMLHNLVVWIRSSTQRYQAFVQAAGRMIPQDNSARWNSWYLMIHVAIQLRKELNSFMDGRYLIRLGLGLVLPTRGSSFNVRTSRDLWLLDCRLLDPHTSDV